MIFNNSEAIRKVTEYNETLGRMLKWYLDDPEPSEEDYNYMRGFAKVLNEIGVITFKERQHILSNRTIEDAEDEFLEIEWKEII